MYFSGICNKLYIYNKIIFNCHFFYFWHNIFYFRKKFTNRINRLQNNLDENYSFREEKEINKLISKLKSPCKQIDEYDTFNKTLQRINQFNSNIIPEWVGQLDENRTRIWNELIHTRRIVVNHEGNKLDIPRRTLKIRRNINN